MSDLGAWQAARGEGGFGALFWGLWALVSAPWWVWLSLAFMGVYLWLLWSVTNRPRQP